MRQQLPEQFQVAARRFFFVGVWIGTVDDDDISQHGRRHVLNFELLKRHVQRLQISPRLTNQNGPPSRRSFASGLCAFGPDQCVDQRTLAGPRAAESGYDQRSFESNSQRFEPSQQTPHQRPRLVERFPSRFAFRPLLQASNQLVHLSE